MEPVQNAGGSFTPPAGYFQGVRKICDRYGMLLCADEVITGFFYALELVKDKETREMFDDEESETLLCGFLSPTLYERGLICRADDRGDPVVQISPPLIADTAEMDEPVGILGDVLAEAGRRVTATA